MKAKVRMRSKRVENLFSTLSCWSRFTQSRQLSLSQVLASATWAIVKSVSTHFRPRDGRAATFTKLSSTMQLGSVLSSPLFLTSFLTRALSWMTTWGCSWFVLKDCAGSFQAWSCALSTDALSGMSGTCIAVSWPSLPAFTSQISFTRYSLSMKMTRVLTVRVPCGPSSLSWLFWF